MVREKGVYIKKNIFRLKETIKGINIEYLSFSIKNIGKTHLIQKIIFQFMETFVKSLRQVSYTIALKIFIKLPIFKGLTPEK